MMELGKEPDVIKNSLQPACTSLCSSTSASTEDLDLDKYTTTGEATEDFGPNLIQLRVTQQIRELQTVIRDKYVLSSLYEFDIFHRITLAFDWFSSCARVAW